MRRAAIVVILALVAGEPAAARAGACGGYLTVTPSTVAAGDVVLLEASGDLDAIERALPGAHFAGDGVTVPARVVRVLRGGRLQALLAVDGALPPATTVHLVVGLADVDERLATIPLATGAAVTAPAPRWRRAPRLGARRRESGHKGDSVDVYSVRVPVDDAPFVLAETGGGGAIYVVGGGAIAIGTTGCHSMWWPPATRGPAAVVLHAIGRAGDDVVAPGKPLRVRF